MKDFEKIKGTAVRVYTREAMYTFEISCNPAWMWLHMAARMGFPVYDDPGMIRFAIRMAKWCDEDCDIAEGFIASEPPPPPPASKAGSYSPVTGKITCARCGKESLAATCIAGLPELFCSELCLQAWIKMPVEGRIGPELQIEADASESED